MTEKAAVFDKNARQYDQWFDRNPVLYKAELKALEQAVPQKGKGIEIGVGTGRFAQPLNIRYGVEPAESMARMAENRGIKVWRATAEELPLEDRSFDFALMVTTVCFLDDLPKALAQVHRILKKGGRIILGIIDKDSFLGRQYEQRKSEDTYYRHAHFHATTGLSMKLNAAGFEEFEYWQTLTDVTATEHEIKKGYGDGSFVVIRARKSFSTQETQ